MTGLLLNKSRLHHSTKWKSLTHLVTALVGARDNSRKAHLCEVEGSDDHVSEVLLVNQGHCEVSQGHRAAHRLRPVLVALDLRGGALEGGACDRGNNGGTWMKGGG